ncbi:putative 2-hydroxyacid dehydrogenase [Diaporthe ampelina]|uniref:Putative 2-hydroxyacid dehydrogenase n=1 Tax=Diaporthe ampelina TaxID=1214573 RepID=A0A0G2F5M0_9PEZI|nr:putative 2-hydroxyacid dehydrogenase [Diaporthe ampelina]
MSGTSKEKLLIFQPKGPTAEWTARVQAQHPGLEIIYVNSALPDGSIKPFEELSAEVRGGVTLLSTYIPPPARLIPDVKFVQLPSAGVDKWLGHETPQIAEWVIGSWLSFQHHFVRYHEQMKTGYWEPMFKSTVEDSAGARMGILGYGAIGRQCAHVADSMGMEVYAYTRSPKTTPEARKDDSYCVPGTGDPDGLIPSKWFHGTSQEDINNFLSQDLDILVLCMPLTSETHGIISHEQFEILSKKKTVARGKAINTDALIQALENGKIRGAAVDGADPEPLPSDHSLWKAPNLLITPHVSWQTHRTWERVLAILEINLEKLSKHETPINVVNRKLHY